MFTPTKANDVQTQVAELLAKYKYMPIDAFELAKYAGFNDNELKLMQLFWEPTFNDSAIYLSDELILNHFTDERGKDAIGDFIKRYVVNVYEKDKQYIEVSKNHELVQKYYDNFDSANLPNQKNLAKLGAKHYYIITGKVFKDILMQSPSKHGKLSRKYYLKVEDLGKLIHAYINAQNAYASQKQLLKMLTTSSFF